MAVLFIYLPWQFQIRLAQIVDKEGLLTTNGRHRWFGARENSMETNKVPALGGSR